MQPLNKKRIARINERRAAQYRQFAVVPEEICRRLIQRLDYLKCEPQRVLDLGSGPGTLALDLLKARYPKAALLACDLAMGMLEQIPQPYFARKTQRVQADIEQLPFADGSVDLVVAASVIQYCEPQQLLAEIRRVLSPSGLLLFTSLGPDSFMELRQAAQQVSKAEVVHDFADMHDLGDMLLKAGMVDPVMDSEVLHVTYADIDQAMRELFALGGASVRADGHKGLRGRSFMPALAQVYVRDQQGRLPVNLEVIYGQAWGAQSKQTLQTEVAIDVSRIGGRGQRG